MTAAAGIDNPAWSCSGSFLDYDRDGDLDLFVVNYVLYDPSVLCYTDTGERLLADPDVARSFLGD